MVSSGSDSKGVTSAASKRLFDLLAHDARREGWQHTLAEIFQQPELWRQTAEILGLSRWTAPRADPAE